MKTHSPLVGFNTNVKHKGKVFHIQTEDSGVKHPHVITHLFADGGRILKSLKTSYDDHLNDEDLTETVRAMMKEQHKAMFVALRDGALDSLIDEALGPRPAAAAPAAQAAPTSATPSAQAVKSTVTAAVRPAPISKVGGLPASTASVRPPAESSGVASGAVPEAKPAQRPAAQQVQRRPNESVVPPMKAPAKRVGVGPQEAPRPEQPRADGASADAASRYVVARPAAVFTSAAKPKAQGVFGQDMISDKSLDEVILGFLAEELGEDPEVERDDRKR